MKLGCWSTLWMNNLEIRNPEVLCSLRVLWSRPVMRIPTPSQWMLPAGSSISSEVGHPTAGVPSQQCKFRGRPTNAGVLSIAPFSYALGDRSCCHCCHNIPRLRIALGVYKICFNNCFQVGQWSLSSVGPYKNDLFCRWNPDYWEL